ncbi:MAG TPA: AMP-binding protein, partial [Rugosimonospora sp.]|nr:AMP-binding protein [Rugosimonospora sp.]
MVDVQERRVRPAWRSARLFTVGRGTYPDGAPAWLPATLDEFVTNVGDSGYPCYFGRQALDRDDLFGVWVPRGQPVAALGADLREFLAATRPYPRRRMVLAAFFEPEPGERDHEWYGDRFWSVLAGLNDQDEAPRPADIPDSPRDPRWEFSFGGTAMFVFAAAPTHRERRSRRLGPGLVMLFQPRNVFHGIEGGTRGGTAARERIRSYLREWDAAPPHPSMGEYGDESNFEWNQYFIGDHARPMFARCPVDPERDARLHDLFSAQARRTPDALALVAGTTTMDYRTLDRAADSLAAHLTAKGIGPEHLVGVMADRSAETVVSLLAVLKAGAAYVPVDPAYPEARRAYLLEDAGVDVVLTPRRLVASVPVGPRWLLLSDDTGTGTGRIPAPARNGGAALPDNLAYVIYTSGSTGEPKGVAVTHRQIVHSTAVQYAVERPYPEAFLLPVSFSFDASGVGLYWTLTTGGTLVLPTDAEHRDPERLRELISRYAVTHIDCAPSLYDVLLGAAGEGAAALRSLRLVQVGGEQCPPALVARHRDLLPECVFENNYGPTEATIWSTTNVLEPDSALPVDTVP